jgi:uncharacterized protein YndB with AHSA1/START domain
MTDCNQKGMGAFRTDVARTYDAKPERVFDAWINPASVRAWLASGEKAIVDARVDGLFYIEMPWKERTFAHYGRYLRIEKPRLLEFTWVSEGTEGKESVVTIELIAHGPASTELRLSHIGLPSEESAASHNGGWSDFLEQLVARLKEQPAMRAVS